VLQRPFGAVALCVEQDGAELEGGVVVTIVRDVAKDVKLLSPASAVKGDVVDLIDLFVVALPLCPVPVPRAKWWGTRTAGPGRLRVVKAELSGWRLHAWKRQGGQGGGPDEVGREMRKDGMRAAICCVRAAACYVPPI